MGQGADQILMAIRVIISIQELFARFGTTGRYGKLECAAIWRHYVARRRQRLRYTQRAASLTHWHMISQDW